jgi:hypothetical protein
MCVYLTLGVSPERDDQVSVHAPAGFRFAPTGNADLVRQLAPLTALSVRSPDMCDCALFAQLTVTSSSADGPNVSDLEYAARRRRQGWSDAKIARAMANQRSASTHRSPPEAAGWANAFRAWMPNLVTNVGGIVLVAHTYSGALDTESIALSGSVTIRATDLAAAPVDIPQDMRVWIVPR